MAAGDVATCRPRGRTGQLTLPGSEPGTRVSWERAFCIAHQGGGGKAGFPLGEQCLPSAGDSKVSHQGREFFFPISQSDEETRNIKVSLLIGRGFPKGLA